MERAKVVLDKVQTTYQNKLMEYEVQAIVVADLIKQLKNEKEAMKDKTELDKRYEPKYSGREESKEGRGPFLQNG